MSEYRVKSEAEVRNAGQFVKEEIPKSCNKYTIFWKIKIERVNLLSKIIQSFKFFKGAEKQMLMCPMTWY